MLYVASTFAGSGTLKQAVSPAELSHFQAFLNLGRLGKGALQRQSKLLAQELVGLHEEQVFDTAMQVDDLNAHLHKTV